MANMTSRSIEEKTNIINEIQSVLDQFKEKEIRLKTLRDNIAIEPTEIHELEKKRLSLSRQIQNLREKRHNMEKKLEKNMAEIEDLRAKMAALKAEARLDIKNIKRELVSTAKGKYLSEFTIEALEQIVRKQRDSELGVKLYYYISQIWNSFRKENGWKARINEEGVPFLQKGENEFPFS